MPRARRTGGPPNGADARRIEALYERSFDALYAYLSTLLDSPADVEDVVQETWKETIEDLPRYQLRENASFRGWLFAIAHNRATDHLRKHGRVEVTEPMELHSRLAELPSAEGDPNAWLSWVSDADLMAALRRLPTMPREVVVLRYVGDLDLAEIATVMGATESAVKQLHRRALIALRGRLEVVSSEASSLRPVLP